MQFSSSRDSFQTPERPDTRFVVVAGLYVAAIVSPALLFVVMEWFHLSSRLLALGLLAAVGSVVSAVVGWQATRQGELVAWFNSPWLALLAPSVGLLPLFAYAFQAFLFFASSVAALPPESAISLIGFVGFLLGIVACCLGGVLVQMARSRLANAMVDDSDVAIEWTAGWTPQDRFKLVLGVLTVYIALSGLAFWSLQWVTETVVSAFTTVVLPFGFVLTLVLNSVVSKRTYRVSTAGLEILDTAGWVDSRRVIFWSQLESFSVTDRTIVLRRQFPFLDVRCSRHNLIADDDVIAALEANLDRHGS